MAAVIKMFYGKRDGAEDPICFIEDIKLHYLSTYAAHAINGEKEKYQDEICRILFRQHVTDRAKKWLDRLDDSIRGDWQELKSRFLVIFKTQIVYGSMYKSVHSFKYAHQQITNSCQITTPVKPSLKKRKVPASPGQENIPPCFSSPPGSSPNQEIPSGLATRKINVSYMLYLKISQTNDYPHRASSGFFKTLKSLLLARNTR